MSKFVSRGACALCQKTVARSAMRRHLQKCLAARPPADGGKTAAATPAFWLFIEDAFRKEFWVHVEIPRRATLRQLDQFLRDIWLECCGHLSAFIIRNEQFVSHPNPEFEMRGMDVPLSGLLAPGLKFAHEYDFGSTTHLRLAVLEEIARPGRGRLAKVLARNHPPPIICQQCGQLATQVCSVCLYEGEAWFFDACASRHSCGLEMMLPVVNSPRVGVCAYTG